MSAPSIQVCQPGFDVRNCPDWAYLFNSDWPSLAIAFEITVTPSGSLPFVVPHNLGFPPLVVGWTNFTTKSYGRLASSFFKVDANNIYILSNTGDSMTLRCFNIDISQEQIYPLPQSAQEKLPYNDQFGIKSAKEGRLIYSKNLNDFVIHSRAQSPAVLQVATQKGQFFSVTAPVPGSGPFIVYPMKTSYIPWALGATQIAAGMYQYTSINGLQVVNNQMIFPVNSLFGGSLIVLRDPLFYPNTARVVY